jgi:hypothetical protein
VLAFGVTIWELLTAKVPFDGQTELVIMAAVRDGKHSRYMSPSEVTEKKAAALIDMCLVAGTHKFCKS